MMDWKEFGEELEKRVEVNKRALEITEKGVSMTKKEYPGTYLPVPKTAREDAIFYVEQYTSRDGVESIRYILKIDYEGAVFLKEDDEYFLEKMEELVSSLSNYENLYVYEWGRALNFIRRFLKNLKSNVIDIKEDFKGYHVNKPFNLINVPWDMGIPLIPDFSVDSDMVDANIYGTVIIMHSLYLMLKFDRLSDYMLFAQKGVFAVDTEEDLEEVNLDFLDI